MRNKNLTAQLRRDFIKGSSKILELNLSTDAIAMYFLMLSYTETFNPNITLLSKTLNMSRNTAYKAINELLKANVLCLDKERVYGEKIRTYSFTSPKKYQRINE